MNSFYYANFNYHAINGLKAYIFHITRHHKHESILYCHYTSMLVLGYTYIQKLFTHLNLAISSSQTNIILPWKQLFDKWYKKYSKAHFLKKNKNKNFFLITTSRSIKKNVVHILRVVRHQFIIYNTVIVVSWSAA